MGGRKLYYYYACLQNHCHHCGVPLLFPRSLSRSLRVAVTIDIKAVLFPKKCNGRVLDTTQKASKAVAITRTIRHFSFQRTQN